MRYFADIERFLEKDILKNPLPEGLGEGPEYRPNAPRKNSRGRGGKPRNGKGNKQKTGAQQQKDNGKKRKQKSKGNKGGGEKSAAN